MRNLNNKSKIIGMLALMLIGGAGISLALVSQSHVSAESSSQTNDVNDGESKDDVQTGEANASDDNQAGDTNDAEANDNSQLDSSDAQDSETADNTN